MANTDIFGNDSSSYPLIKGGMKFSGAAVMAFDQGSGDGYKGMIIQDYGCSYNQSVVNLRGLNTNAMYSVTGFPEGELNINSILAGSKDYIKFIRKYGNACNTVDNTMHIAGMDSSCDSGELAEGMPNTSLRGILVRRLSIAQRIDTLTVNSNIVAQFAAMDIND